MSTDTLATIEDRLSAAAPDLRASVDNTGGGVMVLFLRRPGAIGPDRCVALSTDYDAPGDTLAVCYTDWNDPDDIGAGRMYSATMSDADAIAAWALVLARGWLSTRLDGAS